MKLSSWIRNWKRSLDRRWALYQTLRRRSVARGRAVRPLLESLEDRWLLNSTITVTTAADDPNGPIQGQTTLRDAITLADANPGSEIDFNIGTVGSAQTISVQSALPTITAQVYINGLSQGGSGNTTQLITLNGTNAGSSSDGLLLQGSKCIVSGLIIEDFGKNGIEIAGSNNSIGQNVISGNVGDGILIDVGVSGTTVQGNYIGTDATGANALANSVGISVMGSGNTIGGTSSAARNIISGNSGDGVLIAASGVAVQGNYIGTDVTGTKAVANKIGVQVSASNNAIGGTAAGAGNVISGSLAYYGLLIDNNISGVLVQGNYIGTNAAGNAALANAYGVYLLNGDNNTIGGTVSGAGNLISGNSQGGLGLGGSGNLALGNYIGTNAAGNAALPNGYGVSIAGSNNTVGGTTSGARNLISGNSVDNLTLTGTGSLVLGNYIGTNPAGNAALANNYGIVLNRAYDCTIGGTVAGASNLISGNSFGLSIADGSGNQVLGNYIGTDVTGNAALANHEGVAVGYSTDNTIGGTVSAARNIISGNTLVGVDLGGYDNQVLGNYIGTNAAGNAALANGDGISVAYSLNTVGGTVSGAGNVISGNGRYGINVTATRTTMQGNYIGTDPTGTKAISNGFQGVCVTGSNSTIGGTSSAARNIISGNSGDGVFIGTSGVAVQGNYIGTDVTGTKAIANSVGVEVSGANSTIGGTATSARNVISGNTSYGMLIDDLISGVLVQGNDIGTDVTGADNLGNGNYGISSAGANNTIGGSVANAANIIVNNLKGGVYVASYNGNTIRLNSISANGPTSNGPGITLYNGNNNLAAPILASAAMSQDTLSVVGSFTPPTANVSYTLDFYANTSGDPEGKAYIGSLTVTPTSTSSQSFTFTIVTWMVTETNPLVTATLTDASGNTSRFSNGVKTSGTLPDGEYLVTSTGDDSSTGTLRDAINQANVAGSSITEIDFAIGAVGSAQTINLTSALPALTANGVFINGLSQGGSGNTKQLITLNGTNASSNSDGLLLQASNCTVSGLIIEDFGKNGIEVDGSNNTLGGTTTGAGNILSGNSGDGVLIDAGVSGVSVLGNFIGTDVTGTKALANSVGIEVAGNSNLVGGSNTLAGSVQAGRNIISGNTKDGVLIDNGATGNRVLGNYIGTDYTGTKAVANSVGIEDAGSHNTLGGSVVNTRNVISGNSSDGILLDSTATAETVQGNYLGLGATSRNALANGSNGIEVQGNANTIGGNSQTNYYVRNFISGNGNDGVLIGNGATGNQVQGNFIGIDISGTKGAANAANGVEIAGNGNTIGGTTTGLGNTISGNSGDGILMDSTASSNAIQGNDVGTDYKGTSVVANSGSGIEIAGSNNTLGGTISSARNILSGNNKDGVLLDSSATGNVLQGNYIGTNAAGAAALANSVGIEDAGNHNTIGGSVSGARNVISGNSSDGILLDSTASAETLQSNYIGLDVSGKLAPANGGNGIEINSSSNTIGGNSGVNYYTRNFISGNSGDGIKIGNGATGNQVQGNFIGLDISGTHGVGNVGNGIEIAGTNNSIGGTTAGLGNTISGNTKDGILMDSTGSNNLLVSNYIGLDYKGRTILANSSNGVEINGNNNTIGGNSQTNYYTRNFLSGNSGDGVLIGSSATGNQVQGNFIGIDISGTHGAANANGIEVAGNSNTIGGTTNGLGNTVSGNTGDGILMDSTGSNNLVAGNYIGTDYTGKLALANSGNGIQIQGNNNTIGGTRGQGVNILSGNSGNGVQIDSSASGTLVEGNFIGIGISNAVLGNGSNGIRIAGNNNTIGGTASLAGNTIANDGGNGVLVSIGIGNVISRNSIYSNTAGGISLTNNGNNNLAAPSLTSATLSGGKLTVTGSFTAPTANVAYVLEFFANVSGDAEGKIYLGSLTVTPTTTGVRFFNFSVNTTVTGTYPIITATLTDATGDTSAFSNGVTTA